MIIVRHRSRRIQEKIAQKREKLMMWVTRKDELHVKTFDLWVCSMIYESRLEMSLANKPVTFTPKTPPEYLTICILLLVQTQLHR